MNRTTIYTNYTTISKEKLYTRTNSLKCMGSAKVIMMISECNFRKNCSYNSSNSTRLCVMQFSCCLASFPILHSHLYICLELFISWETTEMRDSDHIDMYPLLHRFYMVVRNSHTHFSTNINRPLYESVMKQLPVQGNVRAS